MISLLPRGKGQGRAARPPLSADALSIAAQLASLVVPGQAILLAPLTRRAEIAPFAVDLARSLAVTLRARACVIDCDFDGGTLSAETAAERSVDARDLLGGASLPIEAGVADELLVIGHARGARGAEADPLARSDLAAVFARLGERFGVTIALGPPVLEDPRSLLVARATAGAVLALVAGVDRRGDTERAMLLLEQAGSRALGAALLKA